MSYPEYTFVGTSQGLREPTSKQSKAPYMHKILGTSKRMKDPSAQGQVWARIAGHPEGINFGVDTPYTPHGHSRGMTAGPSVYVNGGKPLQEWLPLCTRPTGTFEV